jgi:hypothetical protein
LADWRAYIYSVTGVKLETQNAYSTFKSLFPKTTAIAQERAFQRYGISGGQASFAAIIELPFGQEVQLVLAAQWINQFADNWLEMKIAEELTEHNINPTEPELNLEIANVLTDKLRIALDPVCWVNELCAGRILNLIEFILEQGAHRPPPRGDDDDPDDDPDRGPRGRDPDRGRPHDGGRNPDGTIGGGCLGRRYVVHQREDPRGDDLPSFEDTITVTGEDPCR